MCAHQPCSQKQCKALVFMEESRGHNSVKVIYFEQCQSICRLTCKFKQCALLVTTCFDPMSCLLLVCAKKRSLIRIDKIGCESLTHLIRALGKIPDILLCLSMSRCVYMMNKSTTSISFEIASCMVTESWINKPPAYRQIRYPLKLHRCLKKDLGLPPNLLAAQKWIAGIYLYVCAYVL